MAATENDINRLFPKCRVRSPRPETGILIDLGEENQFSMNPTQLQPCEGDSDSEDPQMPPHSVVAGYSFAQRKGGAKTKGCDSISEQRRKIARPRTLDLYESQGAGYEPSPDSEDNDSDFDYKVTNRKLGGFRASSSESHISSKWRKQEAKLKRSSKEVYDVTPSRTDGCSTGESRLEIAGGREVLSRSRNRPQRKRHSVHASTNSSTKMRSVNRYSGEVYYEEGMGRYGFHVDGNTLWGSQGLEPSFSIPSSLSEKATTPSHSLKRPLSWAGDDVSPGQSTELKNGASEVAQILDYSSVEQVDDNGASNPLQGYLTDFYPELVANGANASHGKVGPALNLDNYSLEQLNQFAQSRKEMGSSSHEENCATLATVIGGLTIAQYEGSPRRYGPRTQATTHDPEDVKLANNKTDITVSSGLPRPGFPRRITTSDPLSSNSEPTFSPSMTRQALVQLTQGLSDSPSQMSLSVKDLSPVAVRNDLSAHKGEENSARLLMGPAKDEADRDTASTNAETDLGETEVGLVVGQSRNFTLSPETTDCDTDLEASAEKAPLIPQESPTSSQSSKQVGAVCVSYKFNSMPVLEDGLSSGRNSEDETELIDPLASIGPLKKPIRTMLGLVLHNETTKIKNMNNALGSSPSARNATTGQLKPRHVSSATQSLQQTALKKNFNSTHESEALDSSRPRDETPPPPAPLAHRPGHFANSSRDLTGFAATESSPQSCHSNSNQKANDKRNSDIHSAGLKERGGYASRSRKTISLPISNAMQRGSSPVWVPRQTGESWSHITAIHSRPKSQPKKDEGDEDDERETDQLLDDANREDHGFYDDKTPAVASVSDSRRGDHSQIARSSSQAPANYSLTLSSSLPRSSTSPTPSSFHSISTASSSHSSPQQSTNSNPHSRHSEPKDMKYTEANTPPAANKEENAVQAKKKGRGKEVIVHEPAVLIEGVLFRASYLGSTQIVCEGKPTKVTRMMQAEEAVSRIKSPNRNTEPPKTSNDEVLDCPLLDDLDDVRVSRIVRKSRRKPRRDPLEPEEESQPLLSATSADYSASELSNNNTNIVVNPHEEESVSTCDINANVAALPESPSPLDEMETPLEDATPHPLFDFQAPDVVEGCSYRLRYHGSLDIAEVLIDSAGNGGWKFRSKKNMVEEAVLKLKAPDGETQPTTEVDLFISTEKIMVLNTELKEIMMDHSLRTISYIADIGDLVVIMARRRLVTQDGDDAAPGIAKIPKMICHVFESEEAQFIAQSIGQAFQVAYMEFLKANGIEDQSFVREMDYQEVLNSQEIFSDEIQMFAKKELQKEVIVPKARNEILGVVIVESGWGSMLPTVVIANLAPAGAAARCGQLNIGDQIIAINGISLVGLPLSTCQTYIKNTKSATVVKLTVVPCPPVVEVKIKRPDTKYQLGFSVQNGVICSLLRGGIAERGGVRVGHRIIEINGQSVVAVPHERIVGLLATSVGEIHMKTMPTSMFRLLTGQETPLYI